MFSKGMLNVLDSFSVREVETIDAASLMDLEAARRALVWIFSFESVVEVVKERVLRIWCK